MAIIQTEQSIFDAELQNVLFWQGNILLSIILRLIV